jgi:hypothetical protein
MPISSASPETPFIRKTRVMKALLRALRGAIVPLCLLGAGCDEGPAKITNSEPCRLTTEQQVIDAAIAYIVEGSISFQKSVDRGECAGIGGPPCYNSFPYKSIEEFKQKNPGCCRILPNIPGDEPMTYRPNIRGEKHPKMYLVAMNFEAFTRDREGDRQIRPYRHDMILTISCHGTVPRGHVP